MPTNRNTNVFAEPVEDDEIIVAPAPAPGSDLKKARVKGTWTMYWGRQIYNFEDGKSYSIPADLHEHLRQHGNIYDTL